MPDKSMRPAQAAERLLLFEIGGRRLAVRLEEVAEALPGVALAPPPALTRLLVGFLNLDGALLPVLNMARLLELPDIELRPDTPIIVEKKRTFGWLVSRIERVVSSAGHETAPASGAAIAHGAATIDGSIVAVLSLEKLLLEQERQAILELQQAQEARLRELECAPS